MASGKPESALKPNTQGGRLLRVLVRHWPGHAGGPDEFGNDWHTGRNRMGDTLEPRGFPTVGRQRRGVAWWEYRLADETIYRRAAALVGLWDVGIVPRKRDLTADGLVNLAVRAAGLGALPELYTFLGMAPGTLLQAAASGTVGCLHGPHPAAQGELELAREGGTA